MKLIDIFKSAEHRLVMYWLANKETKKEGEK